LLQFLLLGLLTHDVQLTLHVTHALLKELLFRLQLTYVPTQVFAVCFYSLRQISLVIHIIQYGFLLLLQFINNLMSHFQLMSQLLDVSFPLTHFL